MRNDRETRAKLVLRADARQSCEKFSAMLTSHGEKRRRAGSDHMVASGQGVPAAFTNTGIIYPREEMASTKVFGSVPLAETFLDEPKKRKTKKSKKPKREKSDKRKSEPEGLQNLIDYADICDANLFAQWPEINKKKRKKKADVSLKEEPPLTQNINLKLSKGHKNKKTSCRALDTHTVEHGVRSGPREQEEVQPILSSIQKEKKHKKRVAFHLSPVLIAPKPLQSSFLARDVIQTRCSGSEKMRSFPADGRQGNPALEENGRESQSTSDDINSQDLFITQKSFSDPYIDLYSSTSAEDAQEPQGWSETCPEHQSYTASSAKNRSSPEPQGCTETSPEHPSLPKKPSCPAYHPSPARHHKLDASTQTENFFTSPLLTTSLRFRHQSTCTEQPMDLSLPKTGSKAGEDQRHPAPNVTDLPHSDDSDSHLKSKADLSQLKVIQTRLNESFFFKLKGEGDSPKPRSPLMKFSASVEKKQP